MLRFVGDMLIGWIVYTDSGKVISNVKKNIMSNPQLKEMASLKDIFKQDEDNKGEQNDNQ